MTVPGNLINLTRIDSQMLLNGLLSRIAFESLVEDVVRAYYCLEPVYVSLQVEKGEALLFVAEQKRQFHHQDSDLVLWAYDLIVGQIFGLEPLEIDLIYIDGLVTQSNPYLCIAGSGDLITSGTPGRRTTFFL